MFQDIILCDADSIYFRVACATKQKNEIRKAIRHICNEIKRNCGTDKIFYAVKGRGNFRYDIYADYKGHRKELEPDLKEALNYGHNFMVEDLGAVQADGMEADDLVAIWAYEQMEEGFEPVIAGIDKDLLQIPGWHYNFVKKEEPRFVDADQANMYLMLQCLTGDKADNIPGIQGIGPKKAEKILKDVPMERRWSRVKAAWRGHKAGNPDVSYQLLRMLTSWSEFDDIRNQTAGETPVSKHNVSTEPSQDGSVQELPDGDT